MEETIYSIHPHQSGPLDSLNDWTHLPSQTWKNPSLAQSSFHPETPSPLGRGRGIPGVGELFFYSILILTWK